MSKWVSPTSWSVRMHGENFSQRGSSSVVSEKFSPSYNAPYRSHKETIAAAREQAGQIHRDMKAAGYQKTAPTSNIKNPGGSLTRVKDQLTLPSQQKRTGYTHPDGRTAEVVEHYRDGDGDEARVPAGSSDGGQWTKG